MSDWTLPQHDLPGKAPLPEPVLHARRERVFTLLAALFVSAAALLPLLGTTRLFGASWILRELGREPPVALLVPVGALALPIAVLAFGLVGLLYGARRMRSLVVTVLVVWSGVIGLVAITDRVPAYDNTTTHALWSALALAACGLAMFVVHGVLFAALRRNALRHVAALAGIAAGWGVYAAIARNLPAAAPGEPLAGVALGAGGYVALAVIVGSLVTAVIARALGVYLRVALRPELDDDDISPASSEPAWIVKKRAVLVDTPVPGTLRKRPYTTEELAFFDAGDQLAKQ